MYCKFIFRINWSLKNLEVNIQILRWIAFVDGEITEKMKLVLIGDDLGTRNKSIKTVWMTNIILGNLKNRLS